ncbi:enoyl-CoA hydratase-related protein [Novosphingobium sp. fls2-241-R2A-195]|jgi:2-(1,2-epoxy-1,2-dihydrophenyl)acetyl-CoA isomerase|uniref:enoyl-CoA hydratase/isomerase family protein n=1 Tax=Novosphingobium sp. fls2-241-R2A-195 TaxID=3040296 RepID=UPI00254EC055|nr:enoyl-CoA hydratase-related protein [Novosphingobium sp. fls2-241-R2A-195]
MTDILGVQAVRSCTGFTVRLEAGVLYLTFNRPDIGNAIASGAIPELGAIFTAAAEAPDVRVLLMRAEGAAFCVGGDVKGFAQTIDQSAEDRYADYHARMDRARVQMEAYIALPMPIVVACQGAVAGAAVAYVCGADIALAEPGARFVFPHQRLGLPPDGGLSYLLPRAVGVRKAIELALTAASIDAAEAMRIGIVSRIVETDALQDEALKVARRLADAPRGSVRRALRLLKQSLESTPTDQLSAERDAVAESVADADFEEGVRAFIEKRRPSFPSTR